MAGLLIEKVAPVYPSEGKDAGIQGTVVLHAIIGRDGHVENLTAVSGAEVLRSSAIDAVRRWIYRPYLLNGMPTEVDTVITVNFSSGQPHSQVITNAESVPSLEDRPFLPPGHWISPAIMEGQIVKRVVPDDLAANVGTVLIFHAVINAQGTVTKAVAVAGPDLLRKKAADAIMQWQYKPYKRNGEAIDVETAIALKIGR